MKYCVYYNNNTSGLIEITPDSIAPTKRANIELLWSQDIPRKILIHLSSVEDTTAARIKEEIGHSSSTLHENIRKLEKAGLISAKMIYKGNKQKIIRSNLICVSKNPEHKRRFKKYFQGMWVDSDKSLKIIGFLNKHKEDFFTSEQISIKTKIPVDDVELILSNWDSFTTLALSDFFKKRPFEKKTLYRAK